MSAHRPHTAGPNPVQRKGENSALDNVRKGLGSLRETVTAAKSTTTSRIDLAAHLRPSTESTANNLDSPQQMRHSALDALGGSRNDERAMREVREGIARMEQHIALEVRRRAEADKALQQLIDARAKEMVETLERRMQERLVSLHHQVDLLTKRTEKLNSELGIEREKNVRLTQELKFHASQGLGEVRQSLEHEKVQRMEKEGLLAKKLTEDLFRLQERLDVERHARETMVQSIEEDLARATKDRSKNDERMLQQLFQDVKQFKEVIRVEKEERERGEEHLAKAMSEIVEQVHAGLRALSDR